MSHLGAILWVMVRADAVRFAAAARRLAVEAAAVGLVAPGFRSPPRLPGVDRTLRRRPDGSAVVAVQVRGRSLESVVADMVEGLLAANDRAGGPDGLREALLAAVLGGEARSAA